MALYHEVLVLHADLARSSKREDQQVRARRRCRIVLSVPEVARRQLLEQPAFQTERIHLDVACAYADLGMYTESNNRWCGPRAVRGIG